MRFFGTCARLELLNLQRMDQEPANNPQQGQRMLAAIVFTDVVGFSTLAGIDEAKAIRLLDRDTTIIRGISQQHGASLVKGTGDGVLICFGSAVAAVQAAIDIQAAIRVQNEKLAGSEALRHRVGVHLGDVMLLPNDVIGDGVNIASRLQHEAKPGGIAISDAVYAVVRGKLPFKATNVGPRNLKHIVETVNVWMIPPQEDPAPVSAPIHPQSVKGFELEPRQETNPAGLRLVAIALGIGACIAALIFLAKLVEIQNSKRDLVAKPSSEKATPAPKRDAVPNSDGKEPSMDGSSASASPANQTQGEPSAGGNQPAEPAPSDEVTRLTAEYEFDSAASILDHQNDRERHATRIQRLRRLGEFKRWLEGGIAGCTYARPLMVRGGGEASDRDYELWTSDGAMHVRLQEGDVKDIVLRDMEPRELLRMTAAIFKKEGASANERANIGARARDFAIEMKLGKLPDGLE